MLATLALSLAAGLDYTLFKLEDSLLSRTTTLNVALYIHETIFHLRIYLPLLLFALFVAHLATGAIARFSLKQVLFLYIALWLANEFAFECISWVRAHIFGLVLIPVNDPETYYFFESVLGIPPIACFFSYLLFRDHTSTNIKEIAHGVEDLRGSLFHFSF